MKFKALVAGVLGSFVISTVALAADPIFIPPPAPPPPMAVAPAGYDWTGLYAGGQLWFVPGVGLELYGAQVGFNFGSRIIFGVEGGVVTSGGLVGGSVFGKAGVALGATDRILAYGTIGAIIGGGGVDAVAGGGAALALGRKLSVFAEGLVLLGAGCCIVRTGVNFSFGN